MIKDTVEFKGTVSIRHFDGTGTLIDARTFNNIVVQTGKNFIAARLITAGAPTPMSYMSIGTTNTAATNGDTTLAAENARSALTNVVVSTNTITYSASFGPGVGTGAIVEAGVFNAVTAGTMMARTVFLVVNKGAADTLAIDWAITNS